MMKYKVELGSLVTVVRQRTYIVSAKDEMQAIEKAKKRFKDGCNNSKRYIDCDSIEVDFITEGEQNTTSTTRRRPNETRKPL